MQFPVLLPQVRRPFNPCTPPETQSQLADDPKPSGDMFAIGVIIAYMAALYLEPPSGDTPHTHTHTPPHTHTYTATHIYARIYLPI